MLICKISKIQIAEDIFHLFYDKFILNLAGIDDANQSFPLNCEGEINSGLHNWWWIGWFNLSNTFGATNN
jgi:hypothetical protein